MKKMEFTPRMKQIIKVLLSEQEAISVKNLAQKINVSKRTVQRELEMIQSSLKTYDITFQSKTGVGVWLEGSQEEKQRLLSDIVQETVFDAGNKEERRKRLILQILKEKGLKKLFYYSDQFGVSEATISTDLEAASAWLSKYQLFVVRKPGSGTMVEGSEENYRRAIRAFIDENLDTDLIREAYDSKKHMSGCYENIRNSGEIGQILNDDIMRRVMDCIVNMNHTRVMTLTENSYMGLVIHISIAINRILKNETIESDSKWMEEIKKDEDYLLAEAIVRELEEEFDIRIPDVEISYICLHIKGAKHEKISWKTEGEKELENREVLQLMNEMIDAFDPHKAFYLKQDDEFIQGLLAHLKPTLIRLCHGMNIKNPVLKDIRDHYPEIYQQCEKVAKVLECKVKKVVPAEEIGFLAVHFGAAMVRMEERTETIRMVQVGVVCSSGIGISRLMSSKLEKVFRGRMEITTYGKNDITPFIISKTDFFISSIPLGQTDIPVISVNPLLSDEDMEQIGGALYKYERMPQKQKADTEFTMQLEEINLMAAQINTVIKYMEFFKADSHITFDELLIAIGDQFTPYSDQSRMIREDIMKRERIASQVFAEFGFALLHTRTKGVVRPGFGVCMTTVKGPFLDPYFKGIQAVFVMLVPADEHVKVNNEILGYISTLLIEEYEFMEVVLAGDKEQIRSALSRYLKKFFSQYLLEIK